MLTAVFSFFFPKLSDSFIINTLLNLRMTIILLLFSLSVYNSVALVVFQHSCQPQETQHWGVIREVIIGSWSSQLEQREIKKHTRTSLLTKSKNWWFFLYTRFVFLTVNVPGDQTPPLAPCSGFMTQQSRSECPTQLSTQNIQLLIFTWHGSIQKIEDQWSPQHNFQNQKIRKSGIRNAICAGNISTTEQPWHLLQLCVFYSGPIPRTTNVSVKVWRCRIPHSSERFRVKSGNDVNKW